MQKLVELVYIVSDLYDYYYTKNRGEVRECGVFDKEKGRGVNFARDKEAKLGLDMYVEM